MYETHGVGQFGATYIASKFGSYGRNIIWEEGALCWHQENIFLGTNIYIGHETMLKAYHKNRMVIDDNVWIGQRCFFHSAGGIWIGKGVEIGPGVMILTSSHALGPHAELIENDLEFAAVSIGAGSDIGIGSIILPGIKIGFGAIIGAGSVVTKDVGDMEIVAGNPAKLLRVRAGLRETVVAKDPETGDMSLRRDFGSAVDKTGWITKCLGCGVIHKQADLTECPSCGAGKIHLQEAFPEKRLSAVDKPAEQAETGANDSADQGKD